jgi:uncharacterized protein
VGDALANPLGYGGILRVLSEWASPRREVIVVADEPSELATTIATTRLEGWVSLVLSSAQATEFSEAGFDLLTGRTDGSTPIAYVCEAGVCRLPVTTVSALEALLTQ